MRFMKCPRCGKTVASEARENPSEVVVKIRLLKYKKGGPVFAKCRHCGALMETPFLKAVT